MKKNRTSCEPVLVADVCDGEEKDKHQPIRDRSGDRGAREAQVEAIYHQPCVQHMKSAEWHDKRESGRDVLISAF